MFWSLFAGRDDLWLLLLLWNVLGEVSVSFLVFFVAFPLGVPHQMRNQSVNILGHRFFSVGYFLLEMDQIAVSAFFLGEDLSLGRLVFAFLSYK